MIITKTSVSKFYSKNFTTTKNRKFNYFTNALVHRQREKKNNAN